MGNTENGAGIAKRRSGRGSARAWSVTERLLIAGALLALVAAAVVPTFSAEGGERTTTVRVVRGDTLWSIARAHPLPGGTARTVAAIRELNRLEGSDLMAGQVLRVPDGNGRAVASR